MKKVYVIKNIETGEYFTRKKYSTLFRKDINRAYKYKSKKEVYNDLDNEYWIENVFKFVMYFEIKKYYIYD